MPGGLIAAVRAMRKTRDARQDSRLLLGGSKEEQQRILSQAGTERTQAVARGYEAENDLKGAASTAKDLAGGYAGQYARSRITNEQALRQQQNSVAGIGAGANQAVGTIGSSSAAASGILGQAQQSNQLTGATESILAQRAAAMSAAPSYGQLADQSIAANQANAQQQTNFAQGQLARQAMGMAAGQGEGGALASQQAMASLVGAGGNAAVQSNLQQAQLAADMRSQANLAQRGETVQNAGYASDARLGAAGQERSAQLATAAKQADLTAGAGQQQAQLQYNTGLATNAAQGAYTGATQAAMNTGAAQQQAAAGQANQLASTVGQQAVAREGMNDEYQSGLLTAGVNAGAQREAVQSRPAWAQALFPMGMLGPKS